MFRFSTTPTTGSILDHIFMTLYDPHDAASASKSAAALAASKESAVPLAMMFGGVQSPVGGRFPFNICHAPLQRESQAVEFEF